MTRAVPVAAAALLAAAVTFLALSHSAAPGPTAPPGNATVSPPAAPAIRERVPPAQSALAATRRALRWQLVAEAGRAPRLPARTFTDRLASEVATRPPRPALSSPRAHVIRVREQTPIDGVRRVLATVRRRGRVEHVSFLVLCRPDCRVASIE